MSGDPRRHCRVRLRAAQLLVHTLSAEPQGLKIACDAALSEALDVGELLPSVVGLVAQFADDRETMAAGLRTEIARLRLELSSLRADGTFVDGDG